MADHEFGRYTVEYKPATGRFCVVDKSKSPFAQGRIVHQYNDREIAAMVVKHMNWADAKDRTP